jgi:hypothetical protein
VFSALLALTTGLIVFQATTPVAAATRAGVTPKATDWEVDDVYNCLTYKGPESQVISQFLGNQNNDVTLKCGKLSGTSANPAYGVLHISDGHPVGGEVANFLDCIGYTVLHGAYGRSSNPDPTYYQWTYTKTGYRTGRVVVRYIGGSEIRIVTAQVGLGDVTNDWANCRRS